MSNEIISLFKECRKAIKEKKPENTLVSNCFYLKGDKILALRNPYGDSRYPYSVDGLTLWAYASGNIVINQSNFFISPLTIEGKEPYINFYAGIKNNKDKFDYFSLTGNADTEFGLNFETYTVFTKSYCYYLRYIKGIYFGVKLAINENKSILANITAINSSKKNTDVFVSFYFNPLLTHSGSEDEETKWFRTVKLTSYGAEFTSVEDLSREVHLYNYAVVKHAHNGESKDVTSRRMDYVGDKNRSVSQSFCLKNGSFSRKFETANFIDMSVYGDIVKKSLSKDEFINSNYKIDLAFKKEKFEELKASDFALDSNEFPKETSHSKNIKIQFGELKEDYHLNNELFNKFLKSVIEQVSYSSKTKNSSLMLLGIRDVYQMLEASLLWDKNQAKDKILESLSYIDLCGRPPRQYSKETEGSYPFFDNREFIDQGNWIISTIYKYLAFTGDFSILKEKCCYCELIERKQGYKLAYKESVFDHLDRIINYLISNIDEKTHCLKANYGDWNDAVDGLGATTKKGEKFGNGVSVMASCHLYKNLFEMDEITKAFTGKNNEKYLEIAGILEKGILKNAIKDGRIVHGWGEDQSFYVGSKKDVDNKSRHSATSNAAFVLSGLFEKHPENRSTILEAYNALDSKYGLKTFDEYFDKQDAYKVGRIVNLPKGTAENAATYIHAGMFFVRALFEMNEGKKACDQIFKLIPITHSKISTSPFVMPNSYGVNEELGIDGESMSDWYTGSSNTLLKAIIFDMFGVNPGLDNTLSIKPTNFFPSDEASLSLNIKNKKVTIKYKDLHKESRYILVNGSRINDNQIDLSKYPNKILIEIFN